MILPLLSPAAIHDTYLSTKSTCSTKKRKKTCVHQHHQSQDDKFATNEVPAIFPCQIVNLCRQRALFGFSQGRKKNQKQRPIRCGSAFKKHQKKWKLSLNAAMYLFKIVQWGYAKALFATLLNAMHS